MKTVTLATSKDGVRLFVQCVWTKDRFQHCLYLDDDGTLTPVLRSVEGTDVDDWPPSPPLQEIMESDSKSGECLLGVGMAGKSHWSVAIEASRQESRITWDTACRATQSFGLLGSEYRIAGECHALQHGIRISFGQAEIHFSCDADNSELTLDTQRNIACIRPQRTPDNVPATIRWRYHASLKLG